MDAVMYYLEVLRLLLLLFVARTHFGEISRDYTGI